MVRLCTTTFLLLFSALLYAQEFSMSLGVFTGLTSTFTLDDGISNDPRYGAAYGVKFAPIGMNFGMDYEGFGFVLSPGIVNIGQNFYVVNTNGGQDGKREINLQYLNIPAGFKIHIIKLSFFKVSGVVSLSAAYLLDGEEKVSHTATKLKFPTEVYPILPENYIVQYDGVVVPEVNNYIISSKSDFKSLQLYAAAGFRSDWDINNHWRLTFDFRVNYGLYDPRTDEYVAKVNAHQTLYDIPGQRRDLFPQLSLGISRYIDIEKSDKERKKNLKGSSKKYKEKRYPYPKPRNSKPKG
ncbi:MAG TPA: outer membrane beta-barrel protein [Chryseolinea sp.]|nr:outer membrane beta-barrel protein [Chryseolinea sp.]